MFVMLLCSQRVPPPLELVAVFDFRWHAIIRSAF
jgi:hypothetical protein